MDDAKVRRVNDALWPLVKALVRHEDKNIAEERHKEALGLARSIIERYVALAQLNESVLC